MISRATLLAALVAGLMVAAVLVVVIDEPVGADPGQGFPRVDVGPAILEPPSRQSYRPDGEVSQEPAAEVEPADTPDPAPVLVAPQPAATPAAHAAGEEVTPEPAAKSAERPQLQVPEGAHPVIWVRSGKRIPVRTEPRGGEVVEVADRRTEFGSPTVFGVVREQDGWAGVSTPKLANGRLGWIRLDGDRLKAGWTRMSIVVDLSQRVAQLRKDDAVVRTFPVTIGAPGAETPTGRFAVTDNFRGDLNPVYGCCAVALSATQPNVPSGWLGGNRIAIHGTSGPLGVAASHGCVRAADRDVRALVDRVPLGTPVFIRE